MLKILFLLLNFADAVLTYFVVSTGVGFEANLIYALIIKNSWMLFFIVKILLTLLVIYISTTLPLKFRNKTLMFVCLMYVGIVLNNAIVLVK